MIATMSDTRQPTRAPDVPALGDDAAAIVASLARPEAFDGVYERHHDTVFRYAASRVGPDGAEDIVAEVFAAAFAGRSRFDSARARSALPWLLGITTRLISRQRDLQRRWLLNCTAAAAALNPTDSDGYASGRIDAARIAPSLAQGLAALKPRERDAFLLHVLGELTYEEVAVALSIPIGTVRSRISRARTRLAGLLDGVAR